jgi:hypothetical protein
MDFSPIIKQMRQEHQKLEDAIAALEALQGGDPVIPPPAETKAPERKRAAGQKAPTGETRNRILNFLASHPNCSVPEIVAGLGLPQSTVSFHMLVGQKANTISKSGSGRNTVYNLAAKPAKAQKLPDKKFFCAPCHATFVDEQHLADHNKLRHSEGQFVEKFHWEDHDKSLATESDLDDHVARRHP